MNHDILLTTDDLMDRWSAERQQIYKYRRTGVIPYVKLGHRTIRYKLSDVEAVEEKKFTGGEQ